MDFTKKVDKKIAIQGWHMGGIATYGG